MWWLGWLMFMEINALFVTGFITIVVLIVIVIVLGAGLISGYIKRNNEHEENKRK